MNPRSRTRIATLIVTVFATLPFLAYRWGRGVRPREEFRITGDSMWPTLHSGQICRVFPVDRALAVGDLVAIEWDGRRRIKRIAAVGGQRLTTHDGRLLIDGVRLETRLATRTTAAVPPSLVEVPTRPESWTQSDDQDWLIYRNFNAHVADRETAVMDDYAINENVRRQLNPVTHLIVKAIPIVGGDSNDTAELLNQVQVEFFVDDITRRGVFENGKAHSRLAVAIPSSESNHASELTATRPIRIRIDRLPEGIQLRVFREIEYRVDGPSGFDGYPLLLDEGELFVVGDNVPISVDSRTFGPISVDNVLGIVDDITTRSSQAHP